MTLEIFDKYTLYSIRIWQKRAKVQAVYLGQRNVNGSIRYHLGVRKKKNEGIEGYIVLKGKPKIIDGEITSMQIIRSGGAIKKLTSHELEEVVKRFEEVK